MLVSAFFNVTNAQTTKFVEPVINCVHFMRALKADGLLNFYNFGAEIHDSVLGLAHWSTSSAFVIRYW